MLPKVLLSESKALLFLVIPLIGSGIVESSLNFFSTMFLAHISQEALAAGALVNWVFATLIVIVWGSLSVISTLVSHHHGAQQHLAVARVLRDGLLLTLFISIPCMLLIWNLSYILLLLNQDPKVIFLAQPYLHNLTWAILPDFIFTVLLQFVTGLGRAKVNLVFTLLWVLTNLFLNYVLIFGAFGAPALGIAGIGWGTTISFWLVTTCMILFLLYNKKYFFYCKNLIRNSHPPFIRELLRIGLPMGFMFCIEVGFFTFITLLMGMMSSIALAANQIALQFSTHLSVISFSIANAITIRMGHLLGGGNQIAAKIVGYLGILMALFFMFFVAIVYINFPIQLISLDFDSRNVINRPIIELAKQILIICAFFQIFDSIRITTFGALRALKDTRFTLLISVLTFWIISIPLVCLLSVKLGYQIKGVWWVMVFSQSIGALILLQRYYKKTRFFDVKNHENGALLV